jgi:pimeloyl-ACP methyl ester carboxylesterase
VKEQYLENWFRHFLHSGYHVLVYDNRCFGDSDGLPRNHFNWKQQGDDFVDAVTYTCNLPEVDETKVVGWGAAHSGALIAMYDAQSRSFPFHADNMLGLLPLKNGLQA